MFRLRRLMVLMAVAGVGCGPVQPTTDAGIDAGPGVLCANFPERIDANYTAGKGCWLVLKTPTIAAGVTLTLAPGAKLVFSSETALLIEAAQSLQAIGTQDEPIILTGALPVRGHWRGLKLTGTTVPSQLDYVIVEYGGDTKADNDAAAVKLFADSRGVRASISHTTMRESEGYGLYLAGSAVVPTFTGNIMTKNTLGPANVDAEVAGRLDSTSTFTGNDKDEVVVRSYRLEASATWDDLGVPYHLKADLGSIGSATLTLKAGVRIIMPPEAALTISGTASLIAEGTADKPVVFTGETQTRGAWEGIAIDTNNTSNLLRYTIVEYAGNTSSNANAAGVLATADSSGVQLKLDHLTVRQSQGWGLRLGGSAIVPVFTGNVFTQNALGPAMVDSNVAHLLSTDSTYTGNDVDKMRIDAQWVSSTVTWRAIGVPYVIDSIVRPQAVWTLEPGVTLEMMPMTSIRVNGDEVGFHAVGTALKPITITGVNKTPGSWDGIDFDTTLNAANALEHCVVEYGGGATRLGWRGMIFAHADSHGVRVSVTNSTIQHSGLWGIYMGGSQVGAVTGNTYADNAMGDFFHEP
ncbi:MAG: hypothetical protein Q8L14_17235 [Myxococcales bacterium]|nr:hypothetical protein [Myxococcales bacterium]